VNSPLRSYEGQIRIFLGLLVLFLAVAILLDVQLLVVAREAIRDEVGRRLLLEADVVRAELERDQMLRGLRAGRGETPYIPPAFLERLARLKDLAAIEILTPEGRVLSSSDPARVGAEDAVVGDPAGAAGRRPLSGAGVVAPVGAAAGRRGALLAAYRPIQDATRATRAAIRIEAAVPALAAVQFNLNLIAAVQAGGLGLLVLLVVLFARWLLQPYRRLMQAAGRAPGDVTGLAPPGARQEPDWLVGAFQGVLDKLQAQERELQRLKETPAGPDRRADLPGDHLVGGMSSAVLVFDRDGRLTVLNPAAERLLDRSRAASIGRRYGDLLGHSERLVDLVDRSLRAGESFSREVVPLATAGGREAHLGAMISPIRSSWPGETPVEGVLCLLADLTEIKALRERVGLKENLAALGEMSAGIAHEFRNSLATIQGLARLILKDAGDGGGPAGGPRDHAEIILREVAAVEKIVSDFLRFARPVTLDLAEIDLEALVRDLRRDFLDDPGNAGILMDVEGTFPRLVADATLLRQALHNLLRNAAEAVGSGEAAEPAGGAGRRRPGRIVVRGVAEAGGGVRIVVEDNGPGIVPADLPRLFTPFFTTKDRGTGLGLALVQKAAVVHDGRVEVDSRPDRGARFSLLLPARPGTGGPLPEF
jgi:nitrogen fixation/metabolism regulation signal transduction histidine kinase